LRQFLFFFKRPKFTPHQEVGRRIKMISHGAKKDGIFEIANFKAKTFMETMDG